MAAGVLLRNRLDSSIPAAPVTGAVLDDFAGAMRNNFDSPPAPVWSPYNDSFSPSQTGSILNGMYRLVVPVNNVPDFQFVPYPYDVDSGYAKWWLKSGTWDATFNRMIFWVRKNGGNAVVRDAGGSANLEIGTYSKTPVLDNQPNNQGRHFYHQIDMNVAVDHWVKFILNRHPQHEVASSAEVFDNPTAPDWNYYDGFTRFYYGYTPQSPTEWGNCTYDFDDFSFDKVTGEPDDTVSSITVQYTGARYEITWASRPNVNQVYNVRYSTASLKTNGFSSGTDGGTVSSTNSDYTGCFWASPNMAENAGGLYIGIQPQGGSAFTEALLTVRS